MATIDVKDAADLTVAIEKPLVPGRAAAASSRPVATSNEDFAELQGTNTATTSINTRTGSVTESAPATDTASSGLNGRLQRAAQHLTSLLARFPAALTAAGNLKVAILESTAAQAVTGTFWQATQPVSAASLPLPAGAATETTLVATAAPFVPTATASLTSLASSATSAQLLASTAGRRGLILVNTDANAVLIKYGTTASATSFTARIDSSGYWEMPRPIYTGRIDAIWEADGTGSLFSTELL